MADDDTRELKDIVEAIDVAASRSDVWQAIIDPASVHQWLGCLQFEAEVGHVFYMQPDDEKRASDNVDGATHCEILSIEPEERLVFSWYLPGTPKTKVTIELIEKPTGGIVVQLTHDGWDQFPREAIEQVYEMLKGGWRSFVLPGLKTFVEES
jgi:uncharacterized protein YndB with AHSA1/START domain